MVGKTPDNALHLNAIPLRSITAGALFGKISDTYSV